MWAIYRRVQARTEKKPLTSIDILFVDSAGGSPQVIAANESWG
jgi:hypothetical protein